MQAEALKGGNDSILRSKAVTSVADISDRIRANIGGLASYTRVLSGAPVASPPDCVATPCTPAGMALYDMSQWLTALQNPASGLPGAQAAIEPPVAGVPAGLLTIRVRWADRRNEETAMAEYATQVQF
jgi:hypothetical protein